MKKLICIAVLLPLLSVVQFAQQDAPAPGAKVAARAKADTGRLLPQRGVGGDAAGKVAPDKRTFSEIKIDVEGCEDMTGYMMLPDELPKDRKVALMFTFHGNGDVGAGRVKNVSACSSARDPVITIGVQYQHLETDGKGKMNNPLVAKGDTILEGCRWLLNKTMRDFPVDPERVFVSGFSMGTGYASGWARREWVSNPDAMPFRAVFLYSSGGSVTKETCPPIPFICTVGEQETAVLGSINVVAAVRNFCNVLASWGMPVQYHEIPGMGHTVNGRCHQITRDVINLLGGPGPISTPEAPEPSAFEPQSDPYVQQVIELCNADRWTEALARYKELEADKAISSKDKRPLKAFEKEIEKAAKKELKRVHDEITAAVKAEKMPSKPLQQRLAAILECWAEANWVKGKGLHEVLEHIAGDFPPSVREKQREQWMREAWALESAEGKRNEAKALYERLAARHAEDQGTSDWPKAAAYRLSWWMDGKS
ncbi:MAG: hypothetical protein KF696_01515 [Planctomycetes bacterium]|nr:hypothetical protein [Planctomycetota bacterium]MCW8134381.1 hypothetical protein [Planctomycetota bacterium]